MDIQSKLFELQDLGYKEFHSKLMPNINPDVIIGVRTPKLRELAKEFLKSEPNEINAFMNALPHKYYEENNLHMFCIAKIKDYDQCVNALETFLPYVDNWATCDAPVPKVLTKHTDRLLSQISVWIASEHVYTVRYAIGLLMRCYLDEYFEEEYLAMVANVSSEEYYVNMMRAWYFATALAKQYESAIPWLEIKRLDVWTHNKTIQKAIESYRISPEQKTYLKTLKQ